MQADVYSIQGLAGLNEKINQIKKILNPSLYVRGILLTKYSDRTILNRDLKDSINNTASKIDTKIFKTTIRESVAVRESQLQRKCVLIDNPKNNASVDYKNFINELIRR